MSNKICIVPQCLNKSKNAPDKFFIPVPSNLELKKKWQIAIGGRISIPQKTRWYCCEDHFDVNTDFENYMYLKLMKTGIIRLKPGVVPHIFDCQKDHSSADTSLSIKEEIKIEECTLDNVKEEIELDIPSFVYPNQLRANQKSEEQQTDTTDTFNQIRIKEEVLDTNDTTETTTVLKIKEEVVDIKEEINLPDSTTEENSNKKKEEPVPKKYCDKAVQVDMNLVNVRSIGIQCSLEEIVVEKFSEKRKLTQNHKKTKSKKKKKK